MDSGRPPRDGGGSCVDMDLGSRIGDDLATGSTADSIDHGVRSCAGDGGQPDVAFSWTAPSAGTFIVDLLGSDFDTTMDVLDDCGGTVIDCNDDAVDRASQVRVTLTAGERIVIVVDGFSSSGTYHLNIHPDTPEICTNMIDDDRDGDVDCVDFDCDTVPACTETNCTDGIDNDGDTYADCDDFDCFDNPACIETNCTDGIDNDGDTDIDCNDFDCESDPACIESNCTDGIDNDGDTDIDCHDTDCELDPLCDESMHCHDGMDNDFDGDLDCADFQCSDTDPTCRETNCTDGLDDEGDGDIDCGDFDCDASCMEADLCTNAVDDDTDGATDCADNECTCDPACTTLPTHACPDETLGSALGDGVAIGTIAPYSCGERADACGDRGAGGEREFAWTAPADGTYRFDTEDTGRRGTTYDTVLSIRMTCDGDTEIECDDDGGSGRLSSVLVALTAGQMVIIVLDAYTVSAGGNYTLNIHAM